MYCPVDGIEWREGITRCPEHDVELVDEPPEVEEEPSLLKGFSSDGAMRAGVRVVGWAAVLYAVSGILVSGWFALARQRRWTETSVLDALQLAHEASTKVALGTLGLIAAAVLGRTFIRLGAPTATQPAGPAGDDEGMPPSGAEAWVVTLLTSLVIVFVVVWVASAVAVSWEEAQFVTSFGRPGPTSPPSQTYVNLSALQGASYACGLGALVTLGALLMARAYDRLTGLR